MGDVESIVNGRPLTKIFHYPRDLEALTSNRFILQRSGPTLPPEVFRNEDHYSRWRWRKIQYLLDVFWRRWLKEYLPCLQERQKWSRPTSNFEIGDVVFVAGERHRNPHVDSDFVPATVIYNFP